MKFPACGFAYRFEVVSKIKWVSGAQKGPMSKIENYCFRSDFDLVLRAFEIKGSKEADESLCQRNMIISFWNQQLALYLVCFVLLFSFGGWWYCQVLHFDFSLFNSLYYIWKSIFISLRHRSTNKWTTTNVQCDHQPTHNVMVDIFHVRYLILPSHLHQYYINTQLTIKSLHVHVAMLC